MIQTNDAPHIDQAPQPQVGIACRIDDAFEQWMAGVDGSLALTTYQAGKVALIAHDGMQVTMLARHFEKPMGMAADVGARRLALATRDSIVVLADAPLLAADYLQAHPGKYAALYLPRAAYFTGDVNVHDLAYDQHGALWLVNTRFGCLAQLSDSYSFVPKWKPPFLSELTPQDRCHLNGLAMVQGRPGYVTCLGETDTPGGWREHKACGGAVVDVQSGQTVVRGLSMPHSPRWYEGRLWLLNSGAGELCVADLNTGRCDVVAALPAYLRGLALVGHYALVGMCQIREKHIFGGLPVQQRCEKLLCGVAVIDLRSGRQVGVIEFTSGVQELYEVLFLPGVRRPTILNTAKPATRQAFTAPTFCYWLRPQTEGADADLEPSQRGTESCEADGNE